MEKRFTNTVFPVEWDVETKDQISCSLCILLEQKVQEFIGPPEYVKLRSFIGSSVSSMVQKNVLFHMQIC